MSKILSTIITYDDPECGGAADALVDYLQRDAATLSQSMPGVASLSVRALPVTPGSSHRDLLFRAFQDLFNVRSEDVFVVSLIKNHNPEEYRKIKELCSSPRSSNHQIITHVSNYDDVGLLIRNLVRRVIDLLLRTDAAKPL